MRVVAGKYRGRHFEVPRTFKARPTTDFAKENLFNVLRSYIDFEADAPRALDLFAGTGSITLELLSRGCAHVTSVELDPQHVSFIRQFLKALGAEDDVTLLRADVLRFLRKATGPYDFIFADPPYQLPQLSELPDLVLGSGQWSTLPLSPDTSRMDNGPLDLGRLTPQEWARGDEPSLLSPGGLFVLEHGKTQDFTSHPHFLEHRAYGSVNFSFFR